MLPSRESSLEEIQNSNLPPEKAFQKFITQYDVFLRRQASYVAEYRDDQQPEDVLQILYLTAWDAARDEDFDRTRGTPIDQWIYQRIRWKILVLLRGNEFPFIDNEYLQEQFELHGYTNGLADLFGHATWDLLSGSRSRASWFLRIEAVDLIEKIIEEAKKLPYEYGRPLIEILAPSEDFQEFMQEREADGAYSGAARFETCSSRDVVEFTGSALYYLNIAISYMRKKFPELEKYGTEV